MSKRILLAVIFSALFAAGLSAESIDKLWIVKENTGSLSTMERLENPDFDGGQRFPVLLRVEGLASGWNEGYVKWRYSYVSEKGRVIWTSPFETYRGQESEGWNLTRVVNIALPDSIPQGVYRLAFDVTDGHSGKVYKGSVGFTVGNPETPATPEAEPAEEGSGGDAAPQGDVLATAYIGAIKLELLEVNRNSNRLTFRFRGTNEGEESDRLDLYPYSSRIIDAEGREYNFSETGGGGNLSDGINLPPDVAVSLELFFRRPANQVERIEFLEFSFYYFDDLLTLRGIDVR